MNAFSSFSRWPPYHTRQAFSETIGCPALQPKACWKAAEFCTAPFTRQRPGECGSVSTRLRASWSVTFWHQICPYERKNRCCGVYPSIAFTGVLPDDVHQRHVGELQAAVVGGIFTQRQLAVQFHLALIVLHGDKVRILIRRAMRPDPQIPCRPPASTNR